MEKCKKEFEDGTLEVFKMAKSKILIKMKKKQNQWFCEIGWDCGKLKKDIWECWDNPLLTHGENYNKTKIKELYNIYNSLKKHKNKTLNKKILINSIMIVINEIKQEIYIQQKLF